MRLGIICNLLIVCLLAFKISLAFDQCDQPPYPDQYTFANCGDASPIKFIEPPDTIPQNSSVDISVSGGVGGKKYIWKVRGKDAWLNAGRTIRDSVGGNSVTIYTGPDSCGQIPVTVTDGCSSDSMVLRANGVWVLDSSHIYSPTPLDFECVSPGPGTFIGFSSRPHRYALWEHVSGAYKTVDGFRTTLLGVLKGYETPAEASEACAELRYINECVTADTGCAPAYEGGVCYNCTWDSFHYPHLWEGWWSCYQKYPYSRGNYHWECPPE